MLVTTRVLWAVDTLPRICYLPPPRPLLSHPLLEGTKFPATLRIHRNLQCTIEVALCTPQMFPTVPMSHRATPHIPMLEDLGRIWHTTLQCLHRCLPPNLISPHYQTGTGTGRGTATETQGDATVVVVELAPGGPLTTTSRKQILPQSTIPITPTTIQTAGMTGATDGTAWAPDREIMATRGTATTTILTTITAAAAGAAAMTGTGTGTETEIETETATTPTALTPDTIPTPTALPQTACLLPLHLTRLTLPQKSLLLHLRMNLPFPLVSAALALVRGALCQPTKTTTQLTTALCRHLPHRLLLSHQPLS